MSRASVGVVTTYLVDEGNPTGLEQIVEERIAGAVSRALVFGVQLVGERQKVNGNWTRSFYGYDGHRDVRLLFDDAGLVTNTYDYDAFGNLLHTTGATSNDYRQNGERFDASLGLEYLRARYVNPNSGRFLTTDPASPYLAHPLSLNRYLYGSANPINRSDPTGRSDPEGVAAEAALRPIYLVEHGQDRSTVQFDDGIDSRLQEQYIVVITPDFVNFENLMQQGGKTWEELKKGSFNGVDSGVIKNIQYGLELDRYGFSPEDWEPWDQPILINNEAYWYWAVGGGIIFWTKWEQLYNERPSLGQARAVSLALKATTTLGIFAAAQAAIDAVVSAEITVDAISTGASAALGF